VIEPPALYLGGLVRRFLPSSLVPPVSHTDREYPAHFRFGRSATALDRKPPDPDAER